MNYGFLRGTVVLPCAHPDTQNRGAWPKIRGELRHPLNLGAVTMERDG